MPKVGCVNAYAIKNRQTPPAPLLAVSKCKRSFKRRCSNMTQPSSSSFQREIVLVWGMQSLQESKMVLKGECKTSGKIIAAACLPRNRHIARLRSMLVWSVFLAGLLAILRLITTSNRRRNESLEASSSCSRSHVLQPFFYGGPLVLTSGIRV